MAIDCVTDENVPCQEIVIPSDEKDCIKQIQYSYRVTNLNTADAIDITGLLRVINGVSNDYTEDAMAANPLGPGDIIVIREEVMFDVCLDATIDTVAVVTAEVPNGIPCMDEDVNQFLTGNLAGAQTPTISPGPTVSPSPTITPLPTVTPVPSAMPASTVAPFFQSRPPVSLTASPTTSDVNPLPTQGTPTSVPTVEQSDLPTESPIILPTDSPTSGPTGTPTLSPTEAPTKSPTVAPVMVSAAPTISGTPSVPTEPGSGSPTIDGVNSSPTPTTTTASPTISSAPTITAEPSLTPSPSTTGVDPLPTPPSAGTPTISSSPTVSLGPTVSPSPTVTAYPSSVVFISSDAPTSSFCNVSAVVSCEDEDGEPCNFTNPDGQQCLGEKATELRFIYQAGSFCQGNNTQNNFACLDENPDLPRPATVYIKFYFGDETFYEGIVNSGNIISVPLSGSSNSVVIEISNRNEDNTPDLLLQSMLMSVQCREEDGLVLYDTFGSLQLTGYRNEDQGLNSIFTTVTIRNSAINVGTKDAILSGAFKTNPINGMVPLLPDGASVPLDPGQSQSYSDVFTLNIGTLVGMPIEFSFLTAAMDAETGAECGNSDTYTLLVSP